MEFDFGKETILDILEERAISSPNEICFEFYDSHGKLEQAVTCGELKRRVDTVAAYLSRFVTRGDRVVIVFPPGIDYIITFFATLTVRAIAVPCYPPFAPNLAMQFKSIVENCQPKVIFTTQIIMTALNKLKAAAFFQNVPIIKYLVSKAAEAFDPEISRHFKSTSIVLIEDAVKANDKKSFDKATPEDIAFLQYTSGSTGKSKGVILKHQNITANAHQAADKMMYEGAASSVSWLPPYHDMGLIGGILEPLFHKMRSSLFSPATFLQRPSIWLKLISDTGAWVSGGPNFAYDLCVKRIKDQDMEGIDLSSWTVAFNGADYIHSETLQQFYEKFKHFGFNLSSFYPCYGLAEATLIVTGKSDRTSLNKPFQTKEFENGKRVSCGQPHPSVKVEIVDPETLNRVPSGEVGEIWVQGPNLASGYYNNEDKTREVFQAYIAETGEGPYMRTGDLGSIIDDELYITGRMKDILIFRGRNYYPQDIEAAYQTVSSNIRKGCAIIFQEQVGEIEKIIVIQEVKTYSDLNDVAQSIQHKILEQFAIPVSKVIFVKPKTIPKTTSGKLRRNYCQELYREKKIEVLLAVDFEY